MKRSKTQKGITLVALIITIIVLLILAVVAIRAVQGDGIIAHAKNARDNYNQAQIAENGVLKGYEDYITGQLGNNGGGTGPVTPGGESNVDHTTEDGVPIPKGFTQVEGTTKATGLVITDGTSEFVWIPVETLSVFAKTTSDTSKDTNGKTKYEGVLYKFEGTTATERTGYGLGTTSYREPDNLSTSYDSTDKMSIWSNTLYQDSFDKMVESVDKYKGFYVGRYETSLNGSTAQSKAGETPMNSINWYRMYENSKTYAPENSNKAVVSEMIWGCQWDAMMKFILTTSDASHVTATTNVGHTSSEFTSKPYETGNTNYSTVYTGSTVYNDIAVNIYDLEGNVREWTQEAFGPSFRVYRGGYYSGAVSPSSRNYDGPDYTSRNIGSRLSFYVK